MHHPSHALQAVWLGLASASALCAWGLGIGRRAFDYDEIYHAHAIWLIWQQELPFHDFFACHPPFAWYALVPLWDLFPESPDSLIPFRVVAAAGVAVWLVTLAENIRLGRDIPRRWTCLCCVLVLTQPDVIDFALEFRPDAWWYALLFGAIWLFRRQRPAEVFSRHAVFAFVASWAVMATPKCVLLAVFFVMFDLGLAGDRRHWPRAVPGLICGIVLAAATGWLCLRVWGIDVDLAYAFGINYQAKYMAHSGFRHGLLQSLLARPLLLCLAGASVVAWAWSLRRRGLRPNAYELALIMFLLTQPWLVERPYKQYYAPWYLTVAGFSPYLGLLMKRAGEECPSGPVFGTVSAIAVATSLITVAQFARHDGTRPMLEFSHAIVAATDESSPVVAWLPYHPVVRRDSFYAWNRTTDPAGFSTESIVQHLNVPEYVRRFEDDGYRRQLAEAPPEIIVAFVEGTTSYEPRQAVILKQYLREHRDEYTRLATAGLLPVWRRVAPEPDAKHGD